MKRAFRLSAIIAIFVCLFGGQAIAQTSSPTPDPFVMQITSSTAESFATDMSGDGRFVVIESTGDIATLKPGETSDTKSSNNADGNREIFLFDYVQRRIFQITNSRSSLIDKTKSATDTSNIEVEVSNNRPVISRDGRFIVFSSNAFNAANNTTPANFDGTTDENKAALKLDGNQEIFLYQIPTAPRADLSSGADAALTDLSQGTLTRITNTPASRVPQSGSSSLRPFVADDNRNATINDLGSRIAFVSTRNITNVNGRSNTDGNPEIFVYNRLTNSFSQLTDTRGDFVFNDNPSISGDTSGDSSVESPTSVIAFISNADIPNAGPAEDASAKGNSEIYFANFNGTTVTNLRQVTRTKASDAALTVNTLSPGRRLSRNGNLLAFESKADLTGNGAIQSADTIFVYNISADNFTQVGPRATSGRDVTRFPTFTGDNATLVFTSLLNFRADGTPPTSSTDTTGLNPDQRPQIFFTPAPPAQVSFTRLTTTQALNSLSSPLQPFASNTLGRVAFSIANSELGGGNTDRLSEAFYLVAPPAPIRSDTPASENAVSFVTGASQLPVAVPTATPTPTPSPAPAPGLAPGMLVIARSSKELAPSQRNATGVSESQRRPSLPVELNGVSVSIAGAAAGLFSVGPGEIQFVVPVGLPPTTGTNTYPVVINNNGALIRSTVQIISAQPDIFTTTGGGPGGRAMVFNVTRMGTMMAEPPEGFEVTTDVPKSDGTVEKQPTVLRIILTGVRNATTAQVTVTIKDTSLTGSAILNVRPTDTPGMDQIDVQLPSTLAGAGDSPIIVSVNSGGTFTSRPADTAPRIRIK